MTNFSISDFPLAVTLLALGYPLDCLDRTDVNRIKFCFKHSSDLDEAVQAYWRNELRIEPRLFHMHQKLLKSQMYSKDS